MPAVMPRCDTVSNGACCGFNQLNKKAYESNESDDKRCMVMLQSHQGLDRQGPDLGFNRQQVKNIAAIARLAASSPLASNDTDKPETAGFR